MSISAKFQALIEKEYDSRYELNRAVFAFVKEHELYIKPIKISDTQQEMLRRFGKPDMMFDLIIFFPYLRAINDAARERDKQHPVQ